MQFPLEDREAKLPILGSPAGRVTQPAEREMIQEETQAMLDKGIIEYSDSPWCARIVLVQNATTPGGSV